MQTSGIGMRGLIGITKRRNARPEMGHTYLIIRVRERKRRGDGKVRIKFNKRFLRQKAKISP